MRTVNAPVHRIDPDSDGSGPLILERVASKRGTQSNPGQMHFFFFDIHASICTEYGQCAHQSVVISCNFIDENVHKKGYEECRLERTSSSGSNAACANKERSTCAV